MPQYGYVNSCGRKKRYRTEKGAHMGLVTMLLITDEREPLHVYRCDYGKHWHIGHVETKRDKEQQS